MGVQIERGETCYSGSRIGVAAGGRGSAYFTLAAAKVIEIRHRCQTTRAADGTGQPSLFGTEVYCEVLIWKVG